MLGSVGSQTNTELTDSLDDFLLILKQRLLNDTSNIPQDIKNLDPRNTLTLNVISIYLSQDTLSLIFLTNLSLFSNTQIMSPNCFNRIISILQTNGEKLVPWNADADHTYRNVVLRSSTATPRNVRIPCRIKN